MPERATRWETDSAGLTYTFHLRGDAAFHDGRPLLAPGGRVLPPGARAGGAGGTTWPLEPIAGARELQAGSDSVIPGIVVRDDSGAVPPSPVHCGSESSPSP